MQISIAILVGNANQGISYVKRLVKNFKARVLSYPNSIFEAEPCLVATLTELNDIELLRQTSLIVTPNAYNEGVLYDVIPNTPLGDMDVVRATTATRVNSAGLIEVVPRNLLTYSNDFSNANWTKTSSTVTGGQSGYDGTNNAWLLASTAVPSTFLLQSVTVNQDSVFSVYLKRGTLNWAMFLTSGTVTANFDLLNGVVGSVSNSVATIESVGNGWFRCSMKSNINGTSVRIYPANADNTRTVTGNILIQNSQLEDSVSTTEYFPTTTRLNIPRIDYTNGSCPSLLVEPQRTNLLPYSEQFDNAAWQKYRLDLGINTQVSPSGVQNADTFNSSVGAVAVPAIASQSFTFVGNTRYSYSIFVKKIGNSDSFRLSYVDNSVGFTGGIVSYNLTTQAITIIIQAPNGSVTASMQSVGNGWYRLVLNFLTIATPTYNYVEVSMPTVSTTNTFAIWGAQLEAGAYPTSYIPTVASTVTRNADVISKTGISSLIGQTEGTMFWDINVDIISATNSENILNIDNGGFGTTMYLIKTAVGTLGGELYNGGVVQFSSTTPITQKGRYKCALAYKTNDFALYINGIQIGTDSSGTIGAMSRLQLGQGVLGASVGNTNSVVLWKERLSNEQLTLLTGDLYDSYAEMANSLNYILE
jgi:hypothetical protein